MIESIEAWETAPGHSMETSRVGSLVEAYIGAASACMRFSLRAVSRTCEAEEKTFLHNGIALGEAWKKKNITINPAGSASQCFQL